MTSAKSTRRDKPVREWPEIRAFRQLLRAHAKIQEEQRRFITSTVGLTMVEFDMIAALGNTDGLKMGDLATAMVTSPANVTRVAQVLEGRGLVVRQRSERSDREVLARLTPEGEAFFSEHFLTVANYTAGRMAQAMSRDELQTLGDLLNKVLESPG